MTKRALSFIIIGVLLVLSGVLLLFKIFFLDNKGVAAIQVQSFPKADVYLNGNKIGSTPLKDEKQVPGEYDLKLTTTVNGKDIDWIGKVKLASDTITFVNRELSDNPEQTAGESLILEKLADNKTTEIAVVSDPNGAIVKIDGKSVGTAPITVPEVSAIDHEISLSYPGYRDRFVRGRVVAGYRLNVSAQMAKTQENQATISTTPTPTPTATKSASIAKPYVTIKQTPTGWLRVRSAPSTAATESGRVNPGESFPLLSDQTGWVKIKFKETLEGWVSDSYVEKFK